MTAYLLTWKLQTSGRHYRLTPVLNSRNATDLINPDGSQFTSGRVTAGETKISLQLVSLDYSGIEYFARPGKYTLVALDADENEHERKVNLQPDLSVTDISFFGDQNAPRTIDDYQ